MNDDEQVDVLIGSAVWYANQATALIKKYKECRTEHGRKLLIPKLKHIQSKLAFERRGIVEIMGNNTGEEWKNEA
jgi:hypothetical protein